MKNASCLHLGIARGRSLIATVLVVFGLACSSTTRDATGGGAGGAGGDENGSGGDAAEPPCQFGAPGCDAPCPDVDPTADSPCTQLGQECFYPGDGSASECDLHPDVSATCGPAGAWELELDDHCAPPPECPARPPAAGSDCEVNFGGNDYQCEYPDASCASEWMIAGCDLSGVWEVECE
jgi:hypothetical protein